MTLKQLKLEIRNYNELKQKAIHNIEVRLNCTYWYYDGTFKVHRFNVHGTNLTVDLSKDLMLQIYENTKNV